MLLNQYIIGHCDLLKRFLNCVNLSYIPMIATIVTTFIHPIWLMIFVGYLKWDIFGVALSSTITNGLQLAYVAVYASRREDIKEAIFMPDMDAFNGWKMYLKLAIPATLMLCGEWWYFELLTLTSGYLGVKEQAVMVILLNLLGFIWMVPMGFQEAFCTVIGNSMGENKPDLARKYLRVTTCIALSVIFVWISTIYIFRESVANFYIVVTDDNTKTMNGMFLSGLNVLLFVMFPDSI